MTEATQPHNADEGRRSTEQLGQVPNGADFYLRQNSWGHSIYGDKENEDGSWNISGCLTPLPMTGQTVLLPNGTLWRFRAVEPWGDPRDGFAAVIEKA